MTQSRAPPIQNPQIYPFTHIRFLPCTTYFHLPPPPILYLAISDFFRVVFSGFSFILLQAVSCLLCWKLSSLLALNVAFLQTQRPQRDYPEEPAPTWIQHSRTAVRKVALKHSKTKHQENKKEIKKKKKKKTGLNFNSERKTKLICSVFSGASLRIVCTQCMWTSSSRHKSEEKTKTNNNKHQHSSLPQEHFFFVKSTNILQRKRKSAYLVLQIFALSM